MFVAVLLTDFAADVVGNDTGENTDHKRNYNLKHTCTPPSFADSADLMRFSSGDMIAQKILLEKFF